MKPTRLTRHSRKLQICWALYLVALTAGDAAETRRLRLRWDGLSWGGA